MSKLPWLSVLTLALGAAALNGCANPKLIVAATGNKEQVKFLYAQDNTQGIIKCKVAADGRPSGCRPITLELKD